MRGMILAAGRGTRMGLLTDHTPKPLLRVRNRYLIEHAIESFIAANIREIIINISYHGDAIKIALGDGARYGVKISYSEESEALETGGGIVKALPLLGDKAFIVVSCDIISDYFLKNLSLKPDKLAHIILVDNPEFHLKGDFCLDQSRVYCNVNNKNDFTFANIGIYSPELFAGCLPEKFGLGKLLRQAAENNQLTGDYFNGVWQNIGTASQLAALQDL